MPPPADPTLDAAAQAEAARLQAEAAAAAADVARDSAQRSAIGGEAATSAAGRSAQEAEQAHAAAVTASGSGIDPHISPDWARLQAERIAAARGVPVDRVERLISEHTTGRALGFMGEPAVNVLTLNLALDETAPFRG